MRDIRKDNARNRLKSSVSRKIQTTRIGSLASIEKFFGHLWGQDKEGELTEQEEVFDELYEKLRCEILDKGNNQIRIINNELDGYEVDVLRHEFILRK